MKKITAWSTVASVKKLPCFRAFAEHLSSEQRPQAILTEHIPMCWMPGWNAEDMAAGFEHLRRLTQRTHQVFYPLHSAEERAADPALRENVMFHFPAEGRAPFAVVVPGGGYEAVCSMFEGFPIAAALNRMGCHAFVVSYRHGKNARYPAPQDDLACAVRHILAHSEALGVDPEGYAVIGFSAGGHLAGSFGTESLGWKRYGLPRPGALILGYPVVTMGELTHSWSRHRLLGDACPNTEAFSLEHLVTDQTPPVYLWVCEQDPTVPVENSRMLDGRLTECGVPHRFEVFPGNAHGWGLATGKSAEGWLERAVSFWREHR